MDAVDLPTAFEDVVARYGKVAVLAGSAISLAAPSGLPTVEAFHPAVAACAVEADGSLGTVDEVLDSLTKRPFELLMETLRRFLVEDGRDPVAALLDLLFSSSHSNANHLFLSGGVGAGIAVLMTTNFDTLLEQAGGLPAVDDEDKIRVAVAAARRSTGVNTGVEGVIHLHGSLQDLARVAAFQRRVGRPLAGSREELLEWVRATWPLVVVGYSGRDRDILPALEKSGREVILLNRSRRFRCTEFKEISLSPVGERDIAVRNASKAVRRWMASLSPDQRDLVVAIIADMTGRHQLAVERCRSAIGHRDTPGARLCLAGAFGSIGFPRAAVHTLEVDGLDGRPLPGEAIANRAFYRRNAGDFEGAARDFTAACVALEAEMAGGLGVPPADKAPELFDAWWHAAEVAVLAASGKRRDERRQAIDHAAALVASAEAVAQRYSSIVEVFIYFVKGDLRMLEGRCEEALAEYRRFQEDSRPWIGEGGRIVSAQRESAALATLGRRREAWGVWWRGLQAARSARSRVQAEALIADSIGAWAGLPAAAAEGAFVHQVQYLATLPSLVLPCTRWRLPTWWLFLMRRGAARLVSPGIETAKLGWMRIRRDPTNLAPP